VEYSLTIYLLAGLAIFAAHVVSSVSGFGANIVALPLLAMVVGIDSGKAAVIILSTLMYSALTVRWWRRVAWKELLVIVIVTGSGLVLGMRFFELLPAHASIITLGVFVASVGLQGLIKPDLLRAVPDFIAKVMLFAGGIVHGAFTVGGPLMVIYCHRAIPDKSRFRSTLGLMWVILNISLMIGWTLQHQWPAGTLHLTLVGLPFTAVGMMIGERIHHRVHPRHFQIWVNTLLIVTGIMLAISAAR
jgi:uncharacterized membrane protein YfcA